MLGIFSRKRAKNGLVGVSYSNQELALAYVERSQGGPALQHCEIRKAGNWAEAARILEDTVKEQDLENTRCNFVMCTDDYSLLLIEEPSVEEAELAQAAKWKIKDMVDRPLDQLAISVFRVPQDAYRGQREMLYVVAAEKKRVQQAVDMIVASGLRLTSVDIPELAMLNLLHLQDLGGDQGVAMIDLRHNGSLLSLCKNDALYLTRHLNTQVGEDVLQSYDWDAIRERLVLEIQRSLDYYESQMGQGQVTRLLLTPRKQDSEGLVAQLNEAMGVKVETLSLDMLKVNRDLPAEQQQSCMMAIGGALRVEEAA